MIQEKKKEEARNIEINRQKGLEEKKLTDVELEMRKVDEDLAKLRKNNPDFTSVWFEYELKKNGYIVREALKEYEPKRNFKKV